MKNRDAIKGMLMLLIVGNAIVPQAQAHKAEKGCDVTAFRMLTSCQREAIADYWTAAAYAANISDRDERRDALKEALSDLYEARKECGEQFAARKDLCALLDERRYDPDIDPGDFDEPLQNPYFPLVPGTTRTYEGETDEGLETIVVTVTDEKREILGVECFVVLDVVYLDGNEIENTRDYFAPDNLGNVWYFGENSLEIEDGLVVSTHGSFIAGENGAKPGVVMPAAPALDHAYRQEFALGEAEDYASIVSIDETVMVPFGTFENCVQTRDGTPLEPDAEEFKFYAAGVGVVKEINPESGVEIVLIDVMSN